MDEWDSKHVAYSPSRIHRKIDYFTSILCQKLAQSAGFRAQKLKVGMPFGVSHGFPTTLSSSRATFWSSSVNYDRTVHGRRYIFSKFGGVVLKPRCDIATPGGTESNSDTNTLNTRYGTGVQEGAVSKSNLIIREAYLTDYWQVSDTHCGAFFPNVRFPMDLILRSDRAITLLGNLAVPSDQKRICLVAVEALNSDDLEIRKDGEEELAQFPFLIGAGDTSKKVFGALTMDTLAEFLPRRRPMNRRRTGIAYVSNVAVRSSRRRKGIARRLMREAQNTARSWGCRSMALHVDVNNAAAEALYLREGFKRVRLPAGAKWPQPQALPGANLQLMMKYLGS
ncbi:hypothetical protein R1flu_019878 [Riccia fluitans]|uniref:N-acetyltransferase domain-containing protein n=1 Tax=Riccia fluitans TaxID=41844 RepID=A0ABD1ZJW8_9MARC